jgi:inorganic pyrophosphatase
MFVRRFFSVWFYFLLVVFISNSYSDELCEPENAIKNLRVIDNYTLKANCSFLSGYPSKSASGAVNVVIEIPTGTNEKWEVNKPEGELKWGIRDGKPRVINYLGYPGNYGMVPQTLLSKERGGDGDPLDVIVLGPAAPRGSVVEVKVIGVLKLMDQGEQDDKLIAVSKGSDFYGVKNLDMLNDKFIGASKILELWFANYKGVGKMQVLGFGDEKDAATILDAAIFEYEKNK